MRANKIIVRVHDKLQIYSATLNIDAKFSGLKYFLHHWYYTTTFIFVTWIFIFNFILLLNSFYDFKSLINKFQDCCTQNKSKLFITFCLKVFWKFIIFLFCRSRGYIWGRLSRVDSLSKWIGSSTRFRWWYDHTELESSI
jgi:hypothetical protein